MDIQSIVTLFLQTFISFPLNPLFWMILLLVGFQYRKMGQNETKLLGRPRYNVWEQLLSSVLYGLIGGLIAAIILFALGINLAEIGIAFVWPLAFLLLLVHPRYLCFAYAGGLVGAAAAIVQLAGKYFPVFTEGIFIHFSNIHIPGLLALIGILHLSESILIALSGHQFASPIYLKTKHGVVGGFMLQKFWPLPLVGIMAEVIPLAEAEVMAGTEMPQWWPFFASRLIVGAGMTIMYYLFPIVAGLGYGDIAVSTTPRVKSKRSALNLGLYSVLVLCLAVLAEYVPQISFIAALFAPFGHEFLIHLGNKKEFAQEPIYRAPQHGVQVLDMFDDSEAKAAGIQAGDVIVTVNGNPVQGVLSLHSLLRSTGLPLQLLVERADKSKLIIINSSLDLGIIPVPDRYSGAYMEVNHEHFWGALKRKLKRLKN